MKIYSFSDISTLLFEFNTAVPGTVTSTGDTLETVTSVGGSAHPVVVEVAAGTVDQFYKVNQLTVGAMPAISIEQNTDEASSALGQLNNPTTFATHNGATSAFIAAVGTDTYSSYHYFCLRPSELGITATSGNRHMRMNKTLTSYPGRDASWGDQFHTLGITCAAVDDQGKYYENGELAISDIPGPTASVNQLNWMCRGQWGQQLIGGSSIMVAYAKQVTDEEAKAIHDLMWYWQEVAQDPTDPHAPVALPVPDSTMAAGDTLQIDLNPYIYNDAQTVTAWAVGTAPAGVSVAGGVVTVGAVTPVGTHTINIDATNATGTRAVTLKVAVSSISMTNPTFPYGD